MELFEEQLVPIQNLPSLAKKTTKTKFLYFFFLI